MDLTQYSAYGGGSWNKRCECICEEDYYLDIRNKKCSVWSTDFGLNSEYMRIKTICLNFPSEHSIRFANEDPERFQLLEPVDTDILYEQLDAYKLVLESLDIKVISSIPRIDLYTTNTAIFHPNFVFARDLFAMTPYGAILGRPATKIRAGEEVEMMVTFGHARIPIAASIVRGSFEGADMLWLSPEHIAIDHSSRTSMFAANRIEALLRRSGVSCLHTHITVPGNQHLLGVCNIVNDKVACIRTKKIPEDLVMFMKDLGYRFIEFEETEEVVYKQAMNLVTVAPGEIFMPKDCPKTRDKLERSGYINKLHLVDITELRKMAGGLACMTGIVCRELI